MKVRLRAWLETLGDQFWLRPALIVLLCITISQIAVWVDVADVFRGPNPTATPWGYTGGAEGARALLGVVASSSIGVASTIFSITVAALSLASGQMGPRLLRNFVRDGHNQLALGIFVGTFVYALLVLRAVRTEPEGLFVPHAAVTVAIGLALICVATLVWFVHHIATGMNVETVVDAVHADLIDAIDMGTAEDADLASINFERGVRVSIEGCYYLQAVDLDGLADWAAKTGTKIRLLVRPGDYIPAGQPVAEISPLRDDARESLERAMTFGRKPVALQDLEYSVRQLAEVALRALSPAVNDPFTAGSVLERFGDALCRISKRFLPTGVIARDGDVVLLHPVTDYEGLCDAMFHSIRQNALRSANVLIHLLDVLTKVAEVERTGDRLEHLIRHAELVLVAGKQHLGEPASIADLIHRHEHFCAAVEGRMIDRRRHMSPAGAGPVRNPD